MTRPAEEVPDLLGPAVRADFVANTMAQAQRMALQLRAQQTLNGSSDDEPVPGLEPKVPGAEVPTYGERLAQLEEGIARLWEDNADVREEIVAVAERMKAEAAPEPTPPQGG